MSAPVPSVPERDLVRNDYRIILDLVEPGSRVLDLGCGSGHLLALLRDRRKVGGYGLELDEERIVECIERGLSVFHCNIDDGLRDFDNQSFDYVILNQTLPVTHKPELVILEMARVGRRSIVSFANFAHWRVRLGLLLNGRMPVSETIPYQWFETPNIHHLTLTDFDVLCRRNRLGVLDRYYFRHLDRGAVTRRCRWANFRAAYALYLLAPEA
ncbi:MAG: hypothetical protein BWZ02_00135 [Lentisphaerae bacterium ADurb.BinA184]|nr:MAG: hypothetical protein BWZ02_00135 [Lentisphaerae bacterium ADurb.BinA184]